MARATRIRLFKITSTAAKRLDARAFMRAMVDLDDIEPGDLDWYISEHGHIWTNDAYDQHGWSFFNLSRAVDLVEYDLVEYDIKEVDVV